jgi:F0F1-type ATP synthase assembly protein I
VDLRDRQELNRGLGDSLAVAFELAATTGIFFGIGWFVDDKAGTRPLFMIVLSLLALVGQGIKMWYVYDAQMRRHEQALPSSPNRSVAPDADPVAR